MRRRATRATAAGTSAASALCGRTGRARCQRPAAAGPHCRQRERLACRERHPGDRPVPGYELDRCPLARPTGGRRRLVEERPRRPHGPREAVRRRRLCQGAMSLIDAIGHANAVPAKSTLSFAARSAGTSWHWSNRPRARAAASAGTEAARQAMPARPVAERRLTTEVETGFSAEAACAEATRCYLCCYLLDLDANQCIHCGACLDVRSAESCIVPVWGPAVASGRSCPAHPGRVLPGSRPSGDQSRRVPAVRRLCRRLPHAVHPHPQSHPPARAGLRLIYRSRQHNKGGIVQCTTMATWENYYTNWARAKRLPTNKVTTSTVTSRGLYDLPRVCGRVEISPSAYTIAWRSIRQYCMPAFSNAVSRASTPCCLTNSRSDWVIGSNHRK